MLQRQRFDHRYNSRLALAAIGVTISLAAAACGGDGSSAGAQQVASLGTLAETTETTATASGEDTQEAFLAYAACMRENGIDMADPTFDADGNATGGLFGPDSGIDPQAEGFQAAQEACGSLIEGVILSGGGGGGQGGGLDIDAVQTSLNDFTGCLRDEGLDVDDIEFGGGQGPGAGNGGGFGGGPPAGGSIPEGATSPGGSIPAGGFQGGPPDGGGGPGGDGFDPTDRMIEQLDLDADDPAVAAAIESCQSILDGAFQPTETTTG